MESPRSLLHTASGTMLAESEELEVCCICLDSLCAQPVVALLASEAGPCCPHYMHAACAERLRPRRCPICRSSFAALTTAISKESLQALEPADILAGMRFLSKRGGASPPAPAAASAAALLAAVLPLRQQTLSALVEKELSSNAEQLLKQLGLGRSGRTSELLCGYSPALRFSRRWRWLTLKLAGATGAAVHLAGCGMAMGVVLGCLAALPRLRLRMVSRVESLDSIDSWQFLLLYVVSVVLLELVFLSSRDPRWVKLGLRWGAVLGAVVGWLRALAVVDPDRHSFRCVFLLGLSGRSTWPRNWLKELGPLDKVDIFRS